MTSRVYLVNLLNTLERNSTTFFQVFDGIGVIVLEHRRRSVITPTISYVTLITDQNTRSALLAYFISRIIFYIT